MRLKGPAVTLWTRLRHYPHIGLVLLAYVAFIALGMPDGLLGVAWPSIRGDFGIPLDAVGLLISTVMAGYMTSSFFAGPLIARLGVGRLLAISCAMSGAGLIGYTLVPAWGLMVILGIVAGLGAGAIDAGLNTYVAAHFGEGLMQWLHASYGVGVTLGPITMTVALTAFDSWRVGYRAVGAFELLLAGAFVLTLAMWDRHGAPTAEGEPRRLTEYRTPMLETLRRPQVWLSWLTFFLYVGAEASLGTWTYSLLTGARGIDPTVAGLWAGSYWAMFTVGRVLAGLYAKRAGVDRMVVSGIVGALAGVGLLLWNPAPVANLVAVGVIGFSIAPTFAALISGTAARVGPEHAANTIGLQMTATGLGMAVVPRLMGVLARRISLEVIPVVLLAVFLALAVCYAALVWHGRVARALADA
jgi:fucose permease